MADAFVPRPNEEDLSVNWLEVFGNLPQQQAVDCIRSVLQGKLTLKRRGRLAVFNVGAAKDAARRIDGCDLRVNYQPEGNDPSHAGIGGWEAVDDPLIVALELRRVVLDAYPAVA